MPDGAKVLGDGAHDAEDTTLRGAVGGEDGVAEQTFDGGDEHDGRSRPGPLERLDEGLRDHDG